MRCSRSGGITRSSPTRPSPPPTRTSPTADTPSSRPCSPTSSTARWLTSRPGNSVRTRPGSCARRSRRTCCAPPASSPAATTAVPRGHPAPQDRQHPRPPGPPATPPDPAPAQALALDRRMAHVVAQHDRLQPPPPPPHPDHPWPRPDPRSKWKSWADQIQKTASSLKRFWYRFLCACDHIAGLKTAADPSGRRRPEWPGPLRIDEAPATSFEVALPAAAGVAALVVELAPVGGGGDDTGQQRP